MGRAGADERDSNTTLKSCSSIGGMLSVSTVVSGLMLLYLGVSAWSIGSLWFPRTCEASAQDHECVGPMHLGEKIGREKAVTLAVFASRSRKTSLSTLRKMPEALLLLDEITLGTSIEKQVVLPVTKYETRANKTLVAHIFVWPAASEAVEAATLPSTQPLISALTPITRHLHVRQRGKKMLLSDYNSSAAETEVERWPEGIVPHLRPRLTLKFVDPLIRGFPRQNFPPELQSSVGRQGPLLVYKPVMWVDDLSILQRNFAPLSTNTSLPDPNLTIQVQPINFGMYRLLRRLGDSMSQLEQMGFSEQDLEQIKEMVAGTPWQWLLATFAVSLLHSFFAFLAFKNDVGFWRGRKNMEGLSARSFMANLVCQVIIFLNLLEGGQTSVIVLVEVGVGVAIEGWKVAKIMAARGMGRLSYWRGKYTPADSGRTKRDIETDEYDAYAVKMLSYILYPALVVYAVYCLIYVPQRSWLSWVLTTLSNGVYGFGFIMMTPQLYINYKLKSVAHLPWKAFMYKAFNTFVDDVFAFAISMPLAHRLACLRDDVVFFVYLYQRWCYPIDKTRVNEFGLAYDEEKSPPEEAEVAPKDIAQKKDD